MPRRKRARPADPLVLARRRAAERAAAKDPAAWGIDRAALSLPANAALEIRAELAARRVSARRLDVFDRLLSSGRREALDAVRRLEADLAAAHVSPGGVVRYAERVDAGRADDRGLDRRLRAGRRARRALALAGPASARLLTAFCDPQPAIVRSWRAVVERETGERRAEAQAGALRAACQNLAAAYAHLDRRRASRV